MLSLLKKRKKRTAKSSLLEILGDTEIPSIPAVTMRALRDLRDPLKSLDSVIKVVRTDPSLALSILRSVNSAHSGIQRSVNDLRHAMVLLGRGHSESIILSVAMRNTLPNRPTLAFDPSRFWRTAARRAGTAASLAQLIDPKTRYLSFTAGLLQDLAIPLLAHACSPSYNNVLQQWHASNTPLCDLEREAFGWDHAEVAGWLCGEWSFPDALTKAVVGHHFHSDAPPAVQLVSLLSGVDDNADEEHLVEIASSRYNLAADDVIAALEDGEEHSKELARLLSGS